MATYGVTISSREGTTCFLAVIAEAPNAALVRAVRYADGCKILVEYASVDPIEELLASQYAGICALSTEVV